MGVDHKLTTTIMFLPLTVFVLFLEYDFQFVYAGETSSAGCVKKEREALLSFKESLIDDYGLLSSWGSHDECCKWKGVGCSNATGHVTALQLDAYWLRDGYGSYKLLKGEINSALLQLHHLTTLDLTLNDFGGIRIPEFIGSIKTLQHLNLRYSNFSGRIPAHLGNLTNLRTLDLSFNPHLHSNNLHWLSHLSFLSDLQLTYSKISDANWLQHVLVLPSLQGWHLSWCMLPDVSTPVSVYNSSSSTKSLLVLELVKNELTSSTFERLLNTSFDSLEYLDLSLNMLQGEIPKSLGNLTHLVSLKLSNAQLTGSVPTYLGQFSELESLDLSYNSLEGIVSEAHFMRLHNLVNLRLSFNSLTLELSPSWIPPYQLQDIHLARCKMGPSFPTWLQTLRNVMSLDLSSNIISDHVIDLSFNNFAGAVPQLPPRISLFS